MNNLIELTETDVTIKETQSFHYRKRSIKFTFSEENRKNHAVVFMEYGSISYNISGETICLEKGDILLLKKGETYDVYNSDEHGTPYAFYIVNFDIEENELPYLKRVIKVKRYEKFLELFSTGYNIGEKRSISYKLALKSILNEILHNLYKEYYSAKITEPSFSCMEKAKKYIDINYNEKLNIDILAEVSGFSRAHFKRLFSKYYNMTPGQYITIVRIEHAKSMLEAEIFTLDEIAHQCGFSDEYYFSKVFQKIVGCYPKKY